MRSFSLSVIWGGRLWDLLHRCHSWSYVVMICFIRALVTAVFVGFAPFIIALVAGGSLRFVCAICHWNHRLCEKCQDYTDFVKNVRTIVLIVLTVLAKSVISTSRPLSFISQSQNDNQSESTLNEVNCFVGVSSCLLIRVSILLLGLIALVEGCASHRTAACCRRWRWWRSQANDNDVLFSSSFIKRKLVSATAFQNRHQHNVCMRRERREHKDYVQCSMRRERREHDYVQCSSRRH